MNPAIALPAPAAELAAAVPEREYLRLLGLPRGRALEGDLLDRANGAHDWYARHGQPFVATRRALVQSIGPDSVTLEAGTKLVSNALANRLREGESAGRGPIELLPSGALRPQHSVLAALGVTHRTFANTPEALCRSCDLDPCAFRRAPLEIR